MNECVAKLIIILDMIDTFPYGGRVEARRNVMAVLPFHLHHTTTVASCSAEWWMKASRMSWLPCCENNLHRYLLNHSSFKIRFPSTGIITAAPSSSYEQKTRATTRWWKLPRTWQCLPPYSIQDHVPIFNTYPTSMLLNNRGHIILFNSG